MKMEIDEILKVKQWTSISEAVENYSHLFGNVYQCSEKIYFVVQPYNLNFEEGLPNAPFITQAFWASDIKAIRHAVMRENVIPKPAMSIPESLLLNTDGCFANLKKVAQQSNTGDVFESATYDTQTGDFLYKTLTVDKFRYYFLSNTLVGEEKPYLIELILS